MVTAGDARPDHLVFYDGTCGLCHRSVKWLLARDARAHLRFAPLGGETAGKLGLIEAGDAQGDTLLYVTPRATLKRSRAFFGLLDVIDSRWRWLRVFRFLPAWLTDVPYRLIASTRYRLFGRADACALPKPGQAERFLP